MRNITILVLLLVGNVLWAQSSDGSRYASNSVLASGKWYKVGISESGIYRLTYTDLTTLGMDVDHIDPRHLRVYHNGGGLLNEINSQPRFDDLVEIPIYVIGESDGRFDEGDCVLFYARGSVTWSYNASNSTFEHHPNDYDNYSYAFITASLGAGKRITNANQPSGGSNTVVNTFLDRQVYENDRYNIINGGRTYYSDIIDGNGSVSCSFLFKNAKTNLPCSVYMAAAGRNFRPASFDLYVNDSFIKSYSIQQTSNGSDKPFAHEVFGRVTTPITGDNITVTLTHTKSWTQLSD